MRRRLAPHFDAEPGLSALQHLDPAGDESVHAFHLAQQFVRALADVIRDRQAIHVGEALVDLLKAQIAVQEGETDRSARQQRVH